MERKLIYSITFKDVRSTVTFYVTEYLLCRTLHSKFRQLLSIQIWGVSLFTDPPAVLLWYDKYSPDNRHLKNVLLQRDSRKSRYFSITKPRLFY